LKHNAPSVSYPFQRSLVQALIYLVVWFSAFAVVCSWIWVSQNKNLALLVGLAATILAGLACFTGWKSSPVGQLVWDGQYWHWESMAYQSGMAEYEVFVAADFQHALLLHITNHANATLWLWAERSTLPERWLDLRRAVYSPQRPATGRVATA